MQNFQREIKEAMAPAGTYKMRPHRKFLGRRQEEMGIQSFLVGARRELELIEESAKFKTSCPGSERKTSVILEKTHVGDRKSVV